VDVEAAEPVHALGAGQCRDLLTASGHGILACTQAALPLVVPAEIECTDGQLYVLVHDRVLRGQLVGQVVALTVGRHCDGSARGWTVVARGRVGVASAEHPLALPLEVRELQGSTFGSLSGRARTTPVGPVGLAAVPPVGTADEVAGAAHPGPRRAAARGDRPMPVETTPPVTADNGHPTPARA